MSVHKANISIFPIIQTLSEHHPITPSPLPRHSYTHPKTNGAVRLRVNTHHRTFPGICLPVPAPVLAVAAILRLENGGRLAV